MRNAGDLCTLNTGLTRLHNTLTPTKEPHGFSGVKDVKPEYRLLTNRD